MPVFSPPHPSLGIARTMARTLCPKLCEAEPTSRTTTSSPSMGTRRDQAALEFRQTAERGEHKFAVRARDTICNRKISGRRWPSGSPWLAVKMQLEADDRCSPESLLHQRPVPRANGGRGRSMRLMLREFRNGWDEPVEVKCLQAKGSRGAGSTSSSAKTQSVPA
jgi:hypothetical protein